MDFTFSYLWNLTFVVASLWKQPEVVEGKVDWKGRAALKHKHGGMRASLLVQGDA